MKAELPADHSCKYFSEEQWSIDENPVVFTTGETKLKETASKSELDQSTEIWDLTGDTPRLKWETVKSIQ